MTKLFLFESGSTKTNLLVQACHTDNKKNKLDDIQEFNLSGYNPNRESKIFLEELKLINIQKNDQVFFYGSGLGSEENKNELKAVFQNLFKMEIAVFDDILGSARALYNKDSGVFAILGTGGVAGYYDGESVVERNGGYGYLIDDLGGGYELGKKVVSAWLNGHLPQALQNEIAVLFQCKRENFTTKYYNEPTLGYTTEGLKTIADTVKLIADFQGDEVVNELIRNYFTEFFRCHIIPLYNKSTERELKLSGSLAEVFQECIQSVATQFGISMKETIRYPAHNLLEFHQLEICLYK
ncbi:MAG: glucosamine kinase [Crocinitomix sp.]|jgi:glucosamine kinase